MATLQSLLRMAVGLVYMAVATALFAVLCVVLLPWRAARIRVCNVFGHITGRFILWVAGASVPPGLKDRINPTFPAIYVSNHTSPLDIFVGIWLAPLGTCGVAKKEVVWYPFFGQLYLVSGHLLIDRQNRGNAVEALRTVADLMKRYRLGAWIWPEGTRARDGRLQPFKKGFAHLALATRLPIVPVVVTGAHRGWKKGSMIIEPVRLGVEILSPIPTVDWTLEHLDEHIAEVHAVFERALPPEQLPLPEPRRAAAGA